MTSRQALIAMAVGIAVVVLACVFVVPPWFWHPLGSCSGKSCGYQLWSGIAGSCLTGSGLWTGVVMLYWRHTCKVNGCLRPSWHTHPDHGKPVCRKHHPDGGSPEHLDPDNHQYAHT